MDRPDGLSTVNPQVSKARPGHPCFLTEACRTLLRYFARGMGAVVDGGDLADGQVRIALRGGKSRMAQHLLNGAEVRTLLQHVRAKGVAQRVRMHVRRQAAPRAICLTMRPTLRVVRRPLPWSRALSMSASTIFLRRRQFLRARGQIGADGRCRRIPQRNIALLATLAAHQQAFVGPLHVVEIQTHQLRVADAAAVEQLKDDAIALRPARLFVTSMDACTPSSTCCICSMPGTRGRCFGSLGVDTSRAGFNST